MNHIQDQTYPQGIIKTVNKKSPYELKIEELFADGRERSYPKNQLIHYQGDSLTHLYLLREGHIKAYTILDSGDTRTILLLSPGDIFPLAFSTSLDWKNYHIKHFYQTLTATTVQAVECDVFKRQIETDPAKMQIYASYLSASNQALMNQLEVMKNKKAINKVELLLPYLILKLGDQIAPKTYKLRIRLSHQEVADISGVTRETTTTLVKQLENSGVLEQISGHWIIHTDKTEAGSFEED